MAYEYTDRDGDNLVVDGNNEDPGAICIFLGDEIARVEPGDAPLVALAILESAGYSPRFEMREDDVQAATYWLRRHVLRRMA